MPFLTAIFTAFFNAFFAALPKLLEALPKIRQAWETKATDATRPPEASELETRLDDFIDRHAPGGG